MAFAETGTFNINDGRNANKNYLLSSDLQSDGLCGVRNRANQPWKKTSTCHTVYTWKNMICGSWFDVSLFSHVGKAIHDIWMVYDWFANENLLCGFSVCKSQYVYNNQRLWECIRRRNFDTDTLNDFPIWLSTGLFLKSTFSSSTTRVLQKDISGTKSMLLRLKSGSWYKLCCVTTPVSVDSQV